MSSVVVDSPDAPSAGLSAFICYRHGFREPTLEIVRILRDAGCDVEMDDAFIETSVSHRLQSKANMDGEDCVVVVMPPDFLDWLPAKLKPLLEKVEHRTGNAFEVELVNLLELMQNDRTKPVMLVMLQKDGRPSERELPEYFQAHPIVIEYGRDDAREKMRQAIQRISQVQKAAPIVPASLDVRPLLRELRRRFVTWSDGRIYDRTEDLSPEGRRFAYQSRFYIPLQAVAPGLSVEKKPDERTDSADQAAESQPGPSDVVDFILKSTFERGWLIGDAGSGKTIALTRVGAQAAIAWCDWAKAVKDQPNVDRAQAPYLPILAKYSDLYPVAREDARANEDVTPELLMAGLAKACGRTSTELEALIDRWNCLVMLDGFDEVSDPRAPDQLDGLLLELGSPGKNLRIIITARARDFQPPIENAEIIRIRSLSVGMGQKLVENIADARTDVRARVMQVANTIREASARNEPLFLSSPQAITIACRLASDADDRPVDMRDGELLDKWLSSACGPDAPNVVARRAMRAIAIDAIHDGWVEEKRVREILGAPDASELFRDFDRLAGIVSVKKTANAEYVGFDHTRPRDYLAAEAVADWPAERRVELTHEFESWRGVIEFLPAVLTKRNAADSAGIFLQRLAEFAQQADAAKAPVVWVAGLRSLTHNLELERSAAAGDFIKSAHNALRAADCSWPDHGRASVLDSCAFAGRSFLPEFFVRDWLLVPELDSPSKRIRVANAAVTVAEFGEFVNSPRNDDPGLWPAGLKPSLPDFTEKGGWFDQLRTPLRPVTGVTWFEAVAYCRWLTRDNAVVRLPTLDEWRIIARPGGKEREYPWDDAAVPLNFRGARLRRASPVGLYPAYGRQGLFDFGSNVYEWGWPTESAGPEEGQALGGCWSDFKDNLGIDRPETFFLRVSRRLDTGFRCVREERV